MTVHRLETRLNWDTGGGPGLNVFHFVSLGEGNARAAAEALRDALANLYGALAGSAAPTWRATIGSEVLLDVDEAISERLVIQPTVVTSATAGAPMPEVLNISLEWRGLGATRQSVGRTFFGPLSDSLDDGFGDPTQAFVDTAAAAQEAFIAEVLVSGVCAFGIWGPGGDASFRQVERGYTRPRYAVLKSRRER